MCMYYCSCLCKVNILELLCTSSPLSVLAVININHIIYSCSITCILYTCTYMYVLWHCAIWWTSKSVQNVQILGLPPLKNRSEDYRSGTGPWQNYRTFRRHAHGSFQSACACMQLGLIHPIRFKTCTNMTQLQHTVTCHRSRACAVACTIQGKWQTTVTYFGGTFRILSKHICIYVFYTSAVWCGPVHMTVYIIALIIMHCVQFWLCIKFN